MELTPYLSKLMLYHEIHQLSRNGFSISYISKHLGLNWRTIKRLLSIADDREYERYLAGLSDKNKVLEPYESFVKNRLELYRETSAAQMHDWLKEHFSQFPEVPAKTVFNFVMAVRQKYQLPKLDGSRFFEMVPELAYGEQAQVDFGEYNLRNSQGKRIKVYFLILVLSRSRYKYAWLSHTKAPLSRAGLFLNHKPTSTLLPVPPQPGSQPRPRYRQRLSSQLPLQGSQATPPV